MAAVVYVCEEGDDGGLCYACCGECMLMHKLYTLCFHDVYLMKNIVQLWCDVDTDAICAWARCLCVL